MQAIIELPIRDEAIRGSCGQATLQRLKSKTLQDITLTSVLAAWRFGTVLTAEYPHQCSSIRSTNNFINNLMQRKEKFVCQRRKL